MLPVSAVANERRQWSSHRPTKVREKWGLGMGATPRDKHGTWVDWGFTAVFVANTKLAGIFSFRPWSSHVGV